MVPGAPRGLDRRPPVPFPQGRVAFCQFLPFPQGKVAASQSVPFPQGKVAPSLRGDGKGLSPNAERVCADPPRPGPSGPSTSPPSVPFPQGKVAFCQFLPSPQGKVAPRLCEATDGRACHPPPNASVCRPTPSRPSGPVHLALRARNRTHSVPALRAGPPRPEGEEQPTPSRRYGAGSVGKAAAAGAVGAGRRGRIPKRKRSQFTRRSPS